MGVEDCSRDRRVLNAYHCADDNDNLNAVNNMNHDNLEGEYLGAVDTVGVVVLAAVVVVVMVVVVVVVAAIVVMEVLFAVVFVADLMIFL